MTTDEKLKRAEAALVRIVNEFDEINGRECERGCGKCARCIAAEGLGHKWGQEDPDCGVMAISPRLYAQMTNK